MIKTVTASTFEIDDPDIAVAEILKQIDLSDLRKNSLGLLTCYTDFLDTGTAEAVSKAMPFDVIGITTAGSAVPGAAGELMLSLMVLTSDDVEFVTGASGSITKEQEGPLDKAYKEACAKHPGKPAMMIPLVPFIGTVSGEGITMSLNKVSGGIPLFGSLSIASADFDLNRTLINGTASRDSVVFALLYGDLHPTFFVTAFSEDKIQKQQGVITKSKGHLLIEVNNMPLLEYLKSIGIQAGKDTWSVTSFPFVINYNDGTKPVARSIYLITDDGYAACGGYMPEGATVSVGGIDYDDVVLTTSEALKQILQKKNAKDGGGNSCLLMFSCLTRYVVLKAHSTAEMEKVNESLHSTDYIFSYCGGEICPVYTEKGGTVNRFHNCTFTACLL
jgi:hypothetical protein